MNDQLDDAVRRALADILDRAPQPPDAPYDVALVETDHKAQRPIFLVVAAAAIVTAGIAGVVIAQGRSGDPGPASQPAPTPTANTGEPTTTTSTTVPTVRGNPTCGIDLPIDVAIPSAPNGPVNGPAVGGPAAEGQFAQHWVLPAGMIEVRWPPDPREIYDLERSRGDRSAFDGLSLSVPTGGRQLHVKAERIDPAASTGTDTMTLTVPAAIGTSGWTTPDCSTIQFRYVDGNGNQLTVGYDMVDLEMEPIFGIDLNPLIVATGTVDTAPTDIASCGTQIGRDVSSPVAPTPAEALLGYLAGDAPAGLMQSGYRELHVSDGTIVYTWSNAQVLVTAIRVEPADGGWRVTRLDSAGC